MIKTYQNTLESSPGPLSGCVPKSTTPPSLGKGEEALPRNGNPADCKAEKKHAEEACFGRDEENRAKDISPLRDRVMRWLSEDPLKTGSFAMSQIVPPYFLGV